METIHCSDSSVDCTEALKDNQAFASQLQMCSCKSGLGSQKSELSVFLCCERTTAYGGWNLVVEYCQKKALLRTSKQKPSEQSSSKAPGRKKLDITSTAENNGE